ncbi:MAG: signal peptidase I, partial [Paenibacillaceae bacterium]|nr:signal peptidase I [Paenibacillaceae bacterium]
MSVKKDSKVEEPLNLKRELFEWLKIIVIAAVIAFFINTFLIANSRVPSGSMETTIMTGDRLIGSRLAYRFGGEPQRGDIIIFDHMTGPGNEEIHLV